LTSYTTLAHPPALEQSVTVGPFSVWFTNRNIEMGLTGHSHHAEVTVTFRHHGQGWPSFEIPNRILADTVREALSRPVTGKNEDVTLLVFDTVEQLVQNPPTEIAEWDGEYHVDQVSLRVFSMPDSNHHDHGSTVYQVKKGR